jgi:hypothetical protein
MYRAPDIPATIIFTMLKKLVISRAQSYSMMQVSYPYKRLQSWRYGFVSDGKRKIQKIVDFIPIDKRNIVSLGFEDLLPDGSVDDKANSNNGDIINCSYRNSNCCKGYLIPREGGQGEENAAQC